MLRRIVNNNNHIGKNAIFSFITKDGKTREIAHNELNRMANQFAHYLISEKTPSQTRIALLLDGKKIEHVYAILGIMQANCVNVFIYQHEGEKAIADKLSCCNAKILLTFEKLEEQTAKNFVNQNIRVICYEDIAKNISQQDNVDPEVETSENDIFAIYFTSGSTGEPKAVATKCSSLQHYFAGVCKVYQLSCDDTFILSTPFTFDPSAAELLLPLKLGAKLVIPPEDYLQNNISQTIKQWHVTAFQTTPGTAQKFAKEIEQKNEWNGADLTIFSGGAPLPKNVTEALCLPGIRLITVYGLTETTIYNFYYILFDQRKNVENRFKNAFIANVIGTPLPGTTFKKILIGDGKKYEIGIGGKIVNSYLNEELNKKKILPINGELVFATGDVAHDDDDDDNNNNPKKTCDGYPVYIGRKDNQIKVNAMLLNKDGLKLYMETHPSVVMCHVCLKKDEKTNIDILIVAAELTSSKEKDSVLTYLLAKYKIYAPLLFLPDTMPLKKLNGKVDEQQLIEEFNTYENEYNESIIDDYCNRHNTTLLHLKNIFAEVVDAKTLHDIFEKKLSFHDVGMSSLQRAMLSRKIEEIYGFSIGGTILFRQTNIYSIFNFINKMLNFFESDINDQIHKLQDFFSGNINYLSIYGANHIMQLMLKDNDYIHYAGLISHDSNPSLQQTPKLNLDTTKQYIFSIVNQFRTGHWALIIIKNHQDSPRNATIFCADAHFLFTNESPYAQKLIATLKDNDFFKNKEIVFDNDKLLFDKDFEPSIQGCIHYAIYAASKIAGFITEGKTIEDIKKINVLNYNHANKENYRVFSKYIVKTTIDVMRYVGSLIIEQSEKEDSKLNLGIKLQAKFLSTIEAHHLHYFDNIEFIVFAVIDDIIIEQMYKNDELIFNNFKTIFNNQEHAKTFFTNLVPKNEKEKSFICKCLAQLPENHKVKGTFFDSKTQDKNNTSQDENNTSQQDENYTIKKI